MKLGDDIGKALVLVAKRTKGKKINRDSPLLLNWITFSSSSLFLQAIRFRHPNTISRQLDSERIGRIK